MTIVLVPVAMLEGPSSVDGQEVGHRRPLANTKEAAPLPGCDACGALALDDRASLVVSSVSLSHRPPRRTLLLPQGEALHGSSFMLCGECAAKAHTVTSCVRCDPLCEWGYLPLHQVMVCLAQAMSVVVPSDIPRMGGAADSAIERAEPAPSSSARAPGKREQHQASLARHFRWRAAALLCQRAEMERQVRTLSQIAHRLGEVEREADDLVRRLRGGDYRQALRLLEKIERLLAMTQARQASVALRLQDLERHPLIRTLLDRRRPRQET